MESFLEFKEKNPDSKQKIIERQLPRPSDEHLFLSRYPHAQFQGYLDNPLLKICIVVIALALIGGYFYGRTSTRNAGESNSIISPPMTNTTATKVSTKSIKVYIAGAVVSPGIVEIQENTRVADAISKAGGPTEKADLLYCDMAAYLIDGETVIVPEIGGTNIATCRNNNANSLRSSENPGQSQLNSKISLNNSNQAELETLPGVGPSLAQAIIKFRESNGGFKDVADLRKVKGIGDKRFADLKDLVST